MVEAWEHFQLEDVPEAGGLDRTTFEERYRGSGPVVIRGGATNTPAFLRWDADYLADRVGGAEVTVASYQADRRDYGIVEPRPMRLAEFLAALGDRSSGEVLYLFNNSSCVFMRNEDQPRFHIGWAANANAGLAPLEHEFDVPAFINPNRFVVAVIILGSQENATDLHYDHGGEGKVLVQLRGRKRILLLPPSAAEALRLHTLFRRSEAPTGHSGSRPSVDVHAPVGAADLAPLRGYVTEVAAGDIVYWPPFWFHDVANLDPFTLAVGIMVDELTIAPLLLRHLSHGIFRALLAASTQRANSPAAAADPTAAGWRLDVSLDGRSLGTMAELFADVEQQLLAEASQGTSQLWEWNERLGKR